MTRVIPPVPRTRNRDVSVNVHSIDFERNDGEVLLYQVVMSVRSDLVSNEVAPFLVSQLSKFFVIMAVHMVYRAEMAFQAVINASE